MNPETNAKPRVIVISAAGHPGRPEVLRLLKNGFLVRAFVRREDARLVHENPQWRRVAGKKKLLLRGEGRPAKVGAPSL